MMQPSAGSQDNSQQQQQQPKGKQFLDKYTDKDGPLSQFVDSSALKLIMHRKPSSFQQTVNGAVPQTIAYNKDYYA